MAVYNAWITVSYDPIVGNQQANKCFWEKVNEIYHQIKPKGSRKRTYTMLRSHFGRVDKQVKKFCGNYKAEAAHYQSGASEADILRAALRVYNQDTGKQFKYVDIWQIVKEEERWAGGVRSSSGSTSKRTKHTTSGQYSSGDTGEGSGGAESTPQVFAGTAGDDGGSSRGRLRPQGTKAAKAARARKGRGESSQAGSGSGSGGGSSTLMAVYMTATMADTSRFSPSQYAAWWNGIVHMASQLGLPTPPPPRSPSGDE